MRLPRRHAAQQLHLPCPLDGRGGRHLPRQSVHLETGLSHLKNTLHWHFVSKDARDLDHLIYLATERFVKIQGVPLCVQIATIEFAILDLLGNIARRPVRELIGDLHHPEISIYLGHLLDEMRRLPPEESLALLERDQRETQAKALQLRAGRSDNLAADIDNAPGRTEKLIRLAREKFGPDMTLMIDGNGSYPTQEAIRIGSIFGGA